MALRKVKGNFERMFDKNLTDLVRGIRNNKDNEVSIALVVITYVFKIYDCWFNLNTGERWMWNRLVVLKLHRKFYVTTF